jgi:hypothetical protein
MAEELISDAPTTLATVTKPAKRSKLEAAARGTPGGLTIRRILIVLSLKILIE